MSSTGSIDLPHSFADVRVRQWGDKGLELFAPETKGAGLQGTDEVPKHQRIKDHLENIGKARIEAIGNARKESVRKPRWDDPGKSTKLTWIHIPRNDMALCEAVLKIVCAKKHVDVLLDEEYWSGQLRGTWDARTSNDWDGTLVGAPFMEATAFTLHFRTEEGTEFQGSQWDLLEDRGAKGSLERIQNTIIYMPYLHWDKLSRHKQELKGRKERLEKRNNQHQKHKDLTQYRNETLHPRRSLDEAGYNYHTYESLERRNDDQVVTRFLRKYANVEDSDRLTLMVVDQLWLWILDDDTLVTSFPNTPEKDHPEYSSMTAKAIKTYVTLKFSICLLPNRSKSTELFQALDIASKLANKTNRKAENAPSGDVLRIEQDITAIGNIRDIHEELQMMVHIVDLQLRALGSTHLHSHRTWEEDLHVHKEKLQALSQQATDIHEMLFKTLEVKQTSLSIRQNEVVITFTVVTIVFLPLSFISSIFGMNAAEINNGSPLGMGIIFAYMFPISLLIISFTLVLSFSSPVRDYLKQFRVAGRKSWLRLNDSGKNNGNKGSGNEGSGTAKVNVANDRYVSEKGITEHILQPVGSPV
ncbi:uncharacterized protein BDR25DRAFT_343603 [Lindgomyces ingoldianus]|uniref:Uncharacterized protein n=1 Tax=Lindgomyces ingoldianus TaxID=673940 RepID=A0ACB6QRU0_9PLEO|nr:uncharacterized protein BDR25DRAFT_343603 [Lindgomyces ingoldianus]KAF2469605.1 hypothetical protein BDR25DRAFT_343603 [Lindgomyces ingoldianus]